MAPLPKTKTSINHFTHEGHPLNPVESDNEFKCDGCKTLGTGKRYRCNGCDFDLHNYCGTCPRFLTSFMHARHPLSLVIRKPQQARQTDRVCDVCRDPVEGLFYRCKDCEFDVHPVCTQLPQKLNHALHKNHPLILQSSSLPSFCAICKNSCSNWRYRCSICSFDIHLECVLAPVVSCPKQNGQTGQRGIPTPCQGVPFRPPPQFAPYYGFQYYHHHGPGYANHGPGYNQYQYHHGGGPYMYPQQGFVQPQNYNQVGASNNAGKTGGLGKSMFCLVGQLGFGVLSNMIFGVDVTSFVG